MRFRTTIAVALVAASALVWPPSRRWIADVLISTGIHLDSAGHDPALTPQDRERMRRRFVKDLADELVSRGRTDGTKKTDSNGREPVI